MGCINVIAPVEDIEALWSQGEQYGVDQALRLSVVGDAAQVTSELKSLIPETFADELMINGYIFDYQSRLRSFKIAMAARST